MRTLAKRMSSAVVLVAAVVVTVLHGPAFAEASGTQDFLVINTGPEARVVARGVFTGVGTVVFPEGQPPRPFPVHFLFPEGTLILTITPTGNGFEYDTRSCVLSGPIFGEYTVSGGSGTFTGASGGGVFVGRVVAVFERDTDGECINPESASPGEFHGVQIVRNPGTLSLATPGN